MTIIFLEALAALALFVLAIWWTMFSGRDKGELRRRKEDPAPPDPQAEAGADSETEGDTGTDNS